MREVKGDIMELMKGEFDLFCVTTNGFVKKNGECVMGAGIAMDVRDRFPSIAKKLGGRTIKGGNHVYALGKYKDGLICSFPVKHVWWNDADPELIKKSCVELMELINRVPSIKKVLLPRPGCGLGNLKWKDVKLLIEPLLDDRIYVATF